MPASGAVFGTMWHGSLECDELRRAFLTEAVRGGRGVVRAGRGRASPPSASARLDLLGDLVEEHLDVDALLDLATSGAPSSLPVLEPGASR